MKFLNICSNVFNNVLIWFIMEKKWLIWGALVVIVLIAFGAFLVIENWRNGTRPGNETNERCVPASCCHPTECVLGSEAPNCSGMFCTAVCAGPLDCGAGHCEYVDGNCEVVPNE